VNVSTAYGWPSAEQFEKADLIAAFCYIQYDKEKLKDLEKFLSRGGGFVILHPAVIIPKDVNLVDETAELIGLAWQHDHTRWRHGHMALKIAATDHPICLGLPETINILDEAYWPLKGDRRKLRYWLRPMRRSVKTPTKPGPNRCSIVTSMAKAVSSVAYSATIHGHSMIRISAF
jgi:hypothetical protein